MASYRIKRFSKDIREDVPSDIMAKVNSGDGVVQQDHNGDWRIINKRKGKFWSQKYTSRNNAEKSLAAYHANK